MSNTREIEIVSDQYQNERRVFCHSRTKIQLNFGLFFLKRPVYFFKHVCNLLNKTFFHVYFHVHSPYRCHICSSVQSRFVEQHCQRAQWVFFDKSKQKKRTLRSPYKCQAIQYTRTYVQEENEGSFSFLQVAACEKINYL